MPVADRRRTLPRPRGVIAAALWAALVLALAAGATASWILWQGLGPDEGPADVILVMGTTVRPDGTPGRRLEARLEAATRAYAEIDAGGRAPLVVVTSGLSPEGLDEAAVMAAWLRDRGVPPEAVLEDGQGHNTAASAANLARRFDAAETSVLVVSQYFHIARTRLALRANGFRRILARPADLVTWADPLALAREVVAVWWYAAAGPERAIRRSSGP